MLLSESIREHRVCIRWTRFSSEPLPCYKQNQKKADVMLKAVKCLAPPILSPSISFLNLPIYLFSVFCDRFSAFTVIRVFHLRDIVSNCGNKHSALHTTSQKYTSGKSV